MDEFQTKMADAEALWASGPRKFSVGGVYVTTKDAGAVNYPGQKLPVSRSLPSDPREGQCATLDGHTVRRHADGSYTTFSPGNPTKDKRPIVRSRTDLKHFADRLGSTTED